MAGANWVKAIGFRGLMFRSMSLAPLIRKAGKPKSPTTLMISSPNKGGDRFVAELYKLKIDV